MRSRALFPGVLLFVGTLLLPGAAAADPIGITAGSLISIGGSGASRVHLEGGSRVVVDASGGNGVFDPWFFCQGTPDTCGPGATVSLRAFWSGSDFTGFATVDERTFRIGLQTILAGEGFVDFTGSFVTPLFTGVETVSVVAPFNFRGSVIHPEGVLEPRVALTGRGHARIDLSWTTVVGGAWLFEDARYEFESFADPVPEPATLMLVGSGILGCTAAQRRRRRKNG